MDEDYTIPEDQEVLEDHEPARESPARRIILKISGFRFPKIKWKGVWKDKSARRRFLRRAALVLAVIASVGLGMVFGIYRAIFNSLPDISLLEEYEPSIVTYIYSDDDRVIGEYALQKRVPVTFEQIPERLIQAIIATEDPRFYKHSGIDYFGILRAVKEDLKLIFTPRKLHGGSTITQQLVRELLLHRRQTLRRKFKEWLLARQIEKRYSKQEILTFFCNQFNLGHGAYGVEAAARLYFDKPAAELDLAECAMITGIFRGPSVYSPYRNYQTTKNRRDHVINRMLDEGFITREESEEVKQSEIEVLPLHREDSEFAGHFLEEIRKYLYEEYGEEALYQRGLRVYTTLNIQHQEWAEAAIRRQLHVLDKRQGWRDDKLNLLEQGIEDLAELDKPFRLKINGDDRSLLLSWRVPVLETGMLMEGVVLSAERAEAVVKVREYSGTIDNQEIAWTKSRDLTKLIKPGDLIHVRLTAVDEEKKTFTAALDQEPDLEGAFVGIVPQTGEIKSMVGGYSYQRSKWNNCTQAMRQAGSVIKPMLYSAALENGLTPTSTFIDERTKFADKWSGEIWDPPNYDNQYKGRITLRQGIEESRNVYTAKMLEHISPQVGVESCKRFGITAPIYPYLSLALGAFEVKTLELVSAFTVFPNGGVRAHPFFISRIEDKDGNILEETQIESEEVLSPQIAYMMTYLMKGVVERGTAQLARHLLRSKDLGGKTGTTDDWADARFVGYSPSLCAGVWIGRSESRTTIGERQSGAVAALPVWVEFFNNLDAEEKRLAEENGDEKPEREEFTMPANLEFVMIDRKTGLLPVPGVCLPQFIFREIFLPGTEPDRFCSNEDHMMTQDYYEFLKNRD